MKKALILGGVGFGVLVLVCGGFLGWFLTKAMRLDGENRAFLAEVVPPILESWDPQKLTQVASPELIASAPPEKVSEMFNVFRSRLGAFQSLGEFQGRAEMNATTQHGAMTMGQYQAAAQFTRGPGQVIVHTVKRDGAWRILYFRINWDISLEAGSAPSTSAPSSSP